MGKRILVVDDDKNIDQILHASLSAMGFEVYVARNGEEGLAQFKTATPDLVLLDVLLPKVNGWDVCKNIKNTPEGRKIPVVLMSAVYKTPKMQRDAREKFKADQFLEKPFQLSRLLTMVTTLLGVPENAELMMTENGAKLADGGPDEFPPAPVETGEPASDAAPEPTPEPDEEDRATGETPPSSDISPRDPSVLLEGDFSTVSFPELLHDLYVMGKSGHLAVKNGPKEKTIDVMDGYPVVVSTNVEDEYFGNFLVRNGILTAEQRDESVTRMKESGRLQGTVLIEMGILTPQQVVNYLKLQIREKLFEIFSWTSGTYRFTADAAVAGDVQNVDMSVANIIQEGVRAHYTFDRLEKQLAGYWEHYLQLGSDRRYRFQDIKLTPGEAKIHEMVDGTKTFDEIVSASPVSRERTLQVLFTLIISGMVETIIDSRDDPQTRFTAAEDVAAVRRKAGAIAESETDKKALAERPSGWAGETEDEMFGGGFEPAAPTPHPSAVPIAADEEMPSDDAEVRQAVLGMYKRLADENLFHLLGVGANPTEQEVRIAYHRLAKDFHPDRFFGRASREVKMKVEEIFAAVNDAYDRLNTQDKINQYQKYLEGAELDDESANRIEGVKKVIIAEQRYQNGLTFLKEKRFTRAAHALRQALDIAPNEAEYIAYYGWSLYNIANEKDPDQEELALRPKESIADMQFEAREALTRALEINPRTEKAYLFLGAIYKDQGFVEFAEKQYEKALMCNPNSIEALRELRLIKLRESQANRKKKGLFDRFLKR